MLSTAHITTVCGVAIATTAAAAQRAAWTKRPTATTNWRGPSPLASAAIAAIACMLGLTVLTGGHPVTIAATVGAQAAILLTLAHSDIQERLLGTPLIAAVFSLALLSSTTGHGNEPRTSALLDCLLGGGAALTFVATITLLSGPWIKSRNQRGDDLHLVLTGTAMTQLEPAETVAWVDSDPRLEIRMPVAAMTTGGATIEIMEAELKHRWLRWAGGELQFTGPDAPEVTLKAANYTWRLPTMGMGDFKLLPALGACLGLNLHILSMLIASGALALAHWCYLRRKEQTPLIPYGTHLALATIWEMFAKLGIVPSFTHLLGL